MAFKPIFAAAGMAICLMASPLAATTTDSAPLTAESVTDEQVAAFVRAAIALETLRKSYAERIGDAQTEEAQNEMRAEADKVAIELVERAKGITPDEYLAISRMAQENEALATRISAQVEVMRVQKAEFDKQQAEAARAQEAQRAAEAKKAAEDTAQDAANAE